MKQSEIKTGETYLFATTEHEHKKDMIGQHVTVEAVRKGKKRINKHGLSLGIAPPKYKLSNGRYAKAAEMKALVCVGVLFILASCATVPRTYKREMEWNVQLYSDSADQTHIVYCNSWKFNADSSVIMFYGRDTVPTDIFITSWKYEIIFKRKYSNEKK